MYLEVLNLDWGNAEIADISCVLNSVRNEFLTCFGEVDKIKELVIVGKLKQKVDDIYPFCCRKVSFINLTTDNRVWNQCAYQFSHEYCHFLIPGDVQSKLRWFEESLCELASLYFLPLVGIQWSISPPYESWADYSPYFLSYIEKRKRNYEEFNLDFNDSENPIIEKFYKSPYQRKLNRYAALQIEPIFNENPKLWSCVPLLCEIPDGLDFEDSLKSWFSLAPSEHQSSIEKIANVFSLSVR